MSNDEGSQSAPAFAEATARQANDERALNNPFCHSGFLIVSTFGIRALSFFSSTSDSRFAMKISGAGAQQKRQQKEIMKRFILAFIAAYVFIFFWGWLLNGILLKDIYAETPNLWRSQSEMMSLFHWIIIGQALIVFSFVMIYASGFAGGGVIAGIRLGILLEIAAIGMRMGFYAVQPFPGKLIVYGSIGGLIEMLIVGAIVGAIYKPAPARAA